MGKRSRVKSRATQAAEGPVGPRQPCPCGSGKRYKACHGDPSGGSAVYVARPFRGLAGECDLVAMREFVPSATAPLRLRDSDRSVLLCTLLPGAAPAMVREDGTIWVGVQVQHGYGDASRDLAAAITQALDAEPGAMVGLTSDPGAGPRLQDLVEGDLEVSVHEDFEYWVADVADEDGSLAEMVAQTREAVAPTVRMAGEHAAYWTSVGDKEFLRWVMPEDEEALLDALARLHAAGQDRLADPGRLIGMFRAHGLLVPVWELPTGTGAEALSEPVTAFAGRLAATLGDHSPLTAEERSARSGLTSRQLTLR